MYIYIHIHTFIHIHIQGGVSGITGATKGLKWDVATIDRGVYEGLRRDCKGVKEAARDYRWLLELRVLKFRPMREAREASHSLSRKICFLCFEM